jgi:hypothetical protein
VTQAASGFPLAMRRLLEAAGVAYLVLTLGALVIPPGSRLAAAAAHPLVSTLCGPAAIILIGASWSNAAVASAVFLVPAGIAWAIWRYDPVTGVGLFWTMVAGVAWLACGWLAWAVRLS